MYLRRDDFAPAGEGLGTKCAERSTRDQMALEVELVVKGRVGREETLCRSGRLEPNLLSLSASGRLMRDLCPALSD